MPANAGDGIGAAHRGALRWFPLPPLGRVMAGLPTLTAVKSMPSIFFTVRKQKTV